MTATTARQMVVLYLKERVVQLRGLARDRGVTGDLGGQRWYRDQADVYEEAIEATGE